MHINIDIVNSRNKLAIKLCKRDDLYQCITSLNNNKIHAINVGYEVAKYIDSLDDFRYLTIDVEDYLFKLLTNYKFTLPNSTTGISAIYNFGILLEPVLKLNPISIFSSFSKNDILLILWSDLIDDSGILFWEAQRDKYIYDFSETKFKIVDYEI